MKIKCVQKVAIIGTIVCAMAVVLLIAVSCAGNTEPVEEMVVQDANDPANNPAHTAEPLSISYTAQQGFSLPTGVLEYGFDYDIPGTIVSNYPLEQVRATVTSESGEVIIDESVRFDASDNVYEYRLHEEGRRRQSETLSDLCDLTYLMPGNYNLYLTAKTVNSDEAHEMAQTEFELEKTQYVTLTEEYFSDSYDIALEFFGGDEEKFLFDYIPPIEERDITTDPAWFREYIVRLPDFMNEPLYVHVDARQNFEDLIDFLETTRLRVTTPGDSSQTDSDSTPVSVDTGIIKLSDLVQSYDGGYVSRFTSSLKLVSHHAFGTAIDLNASIIPNTYDLSNREILRNDVENHLEYNGIKEENGVKYYDFTYTGEWDEFYAGVPATCLNYLLYELAFYRAGFSWGYYYESVCDAMHYTLTEKELSLHDDGLRKVYEYYK